MDVELDAFTRRISKYSLFLFLPSSQADAITFVLSPCILCSCILVFLEFFLSWLKPFSLSLSLSFSLSLSLSLYCICVVAVHFAFAASIVIELFVSLLYFRSRQVTLPHRLTLILLFHFGRRGSKKKKLNSLLASPSPDSFESLVRLAFQFSLHR